MNTQRNHKALLRAAGALFLAGAANVTLMAVSGYAAPDDNTFTINGDTITGVYGIGADLPAAEVFGLGLTPDQMGNITSFTCVGGTTQRHGGPGGADECILAQPTHTIQVTIVGNLAWPASVELAPFASFDGRTYTQLPQLIAHQTSERAGGGQPLPPVSTSTPASVSTPTPAQVADPPAVSEGGVGGTGSGLGLRWAWMALAAAGLALGGVQVIAYRRGQPAVANADAVEQPQLPPNEVFKPQPTEPEYVSTGRTREKEGTRKPDVVQYDPVEALKDHGGPPVWIDDSMARLLNHAMANWVFNEEMGPVNTIRVHYGDDPWLIEDPAFTGMAPGDKLEKAFRQMYDSGMLGEEFKEALLALLEPESLVLFGAFVGIQFVPGVNVVVDIAGLGLLLLAFGAQLDDFLTAMSKAKKAINKQQFDYAVKDMAKIIAGVGTTVLVTLGIGAAKWVKGKVTSSKPAAPKAGPKPKNPELNTGGVRDALPSEPTVKPKNPELNTGGVRDALPQSNQNGLAPKSPGDVGTPPVVKQGVGQVLDPQTGKPIPAPKFPVDHPIGDMPTWHGEPTTDSPTWHGDPAKAPSIGLRPKVDPFTGTPIDPMTGDARPSPLYPPIGVEDAPTEKFTLPKGKLGGGTGPTGTERLDGATGPTGTQKVDVTIPGFPELGPIK